MVFRESIVTIDEHLNQMPFPEKFYNEIYCSSIKEAPDITVTYESNFSIKYVLKGSESYILDGQKYEPKAGQYLIINDG